VVPCTPLGSVCDRPMRLSMSPSGGEALKILGGQKALAGTGEGTVGGGHLPPWGSTPRIFLKNVGSLMHFGSFYVRKYASVPYSKVSVNDLYRISGGGVTDSLTLSLLCIGVN